jgi:hypothetical protein
MMSGVFLTQFILQILKLWKVPLILPVDPFGGFSVLELISICLTIGLVEEGMFRYLMYDCILLKWLKSPIILATCLSSLLFGLAHFNNVISGYTLFTLPQVIGAFLVGFWFVYLYKKIGLHIAILSHALYDFFCFMIQRGAIKEAFLIYVMILGGIVLSILILIHTFKKRYNCLS